MFHFPTFPPLTLCVQVRVTGHDSCRVSPFGNPRITARLAAPRGFSQPPTSFIGSWCQGIHRAPLLTWPQSLFDARVHCAVLKVRAGFQTRARRVPAGAGRSTKGAVPVPWPRREGRGRESEVPCGVSRPFPQDPTACRGRPSPNRTSGRILRPGPSLPRTAGHAGKRDQSEWAARILRTA